MTTLDQPLQPKISRFLDGLRRKKLKSDIQLVELFVGKPAETLNEIPPEALRGDIYGIADDIAAVVQRRADDKRSSVRAQLIVEGEEPLHLLCNPTPVPVTQVLARRERDVLDADLAGHDGFDIRQTGAPKLSHQAAQFALDFNHQNQVMFKLTIASAVRREERDAREIAQLRAQVARYQEVLDKAVLLREQLLDRQAERQLEVDRVKQKDQWIQDGFAKIVSLVVLHAPDVMHKFGIDVDPRAREVLFDVVGSVAAAKPYVQAMKTAALIADKNASANGVTPTNGTAPTAGSIASSTITAGGETIGASALAVYASVAVEFINSVKDKLSMVRMALDENQTKLLNQLLELTEAHGKVFQTIGQAALQGGSQVTAAAPPDSEEDKRILRLMELSATYWESLRPEDVEKMRAFLPTRAREALDEIRKQEVLKSN
jgi:hypothetical protein